MNAPHAPSLLATVDLAPRDPILGVTEAFLADPNPRKVNLGVGVYVNDEGKLPLLECVRRAEQLLTARGAPHPYLPIDGIAAYDRAVQSLVLGAESDAVREGRAVTVQALGGTGGLKIGADFLRRFAPTAQVWISDPSWENHRALFEGAGFVVNTYPYYKPATHGLDFAGMCATLEKLPPGAIVVLHACCHNPTGADPTREQWAKLLDIVRGRGLVPFLDIAYQGFADGIAQDGEVVRKFAATPGPLFISSSFSKSFSLYGERVRCSHDRRRRRRRGGARAFTGETRRTRQLLEPSVVRWPGCRHGARDARAARAVGARARWMRERIRTMRKALVHESPSVCTAAISDSCWISGECSRTRASPGHRCSGCVTSSPSTQSTPAASASPH